MLPKGHSRSLQKLFCFHILKGLAALWLALTGECVPLLNEGGFLEHADPAGGLIPLTRIRRQARVAALHLYYRMHY